MTGVTLSYDGDVRSGYVLQMLMGGLSEYDLNLYVATYFATRGKLTHLDKVVDIEGYFEYTALTGACERGCLENIKCLLAAGADKDNSDIEGRTPLL